MPIAGVAYALDRVRSPALKLVLARSAWLRTIAASRALRIEFLAFASIAVALALTISAPVTMFVWGPLVLGVPHLVGDVRYLVLQPYSPTLQRWRDLSVAALLIAAAWYSSSLVSVQIGGAAVLAALVLTPLAARTARALLRRAAWLAVAVTLYVVVYRNPLLSLYVLAHGHNVVAILLFTVVFGRGRARWVVPVVAAGGTALIVGGAFDIWLPVRQLEEFTGYLLPTSALDAWSPTMCARITVAFVFLQSVHYTIWLRLIPEQLRQRNGMRSFTASLRSLQQDFSGVVVWAIVAVAIGLLALGMRNAVDARQWYLRIAGSHAYLELAFLARWLAR